MRLRFSLFTKILCWFFLNLLLLGVALVLIFNLQFNVNPLSPLFGQSARRIEAVGQLISEESRNKTREDRDTIVQRYTEAYGVTFFLFANDGRQLGGKEITLPPDVMANLRKERPRDEPPPPDMQPPADHPPPPIRHPVFTVKTTDPTQYWMGVRIPVRENTDPPTHATLIAVSDSVSGHGLFFDPIPWILIVAVIIVFSILFWLPMVRSITGALAQTTKAAEQIAEGKFDVRVEEKRTDEIGRLGAAINHLASRLAGFVNGQKRFLGDISHELRSPIARIQVALDILEQRVDEKNLAYVADLQEEVRHMSNLVNELLSFSKASIKPGDVKLEKVPLLALTRQAVEREAIDGAAISVAVDDSIQVMVHPELLSRAIANIVRNAVRYAGTAGQVTVSAERLGAQVHLAIADCGPGVPEEDIDKLFDPFYRLEPDRARHTGGVGLGLAIVKTCMEACKGRVTAKNLQPAGFAVTLILNEAA